MEKLITYWNEYLGDCNVVHKYLKEREKKSSNKLVWKFLRFGQDEDLSGSPRGSFHRHLQLRHSQQQHQQQEWK